MKLKISKITDQKVPAIIFIGNSIGSVLLVERGLSQDEVLDILLRDSDWTEILEQLRPRMSVRFILGQPRTEIEHSRTWDGVKYVDEPTFKKPRTVEVEEFEWN